MCITLKVTFAITEWHKNNIWSIYILVQDRACQMKGVVLTFFGLKCQ